jgi:hypothetical protein
MATASPVCCVERIGEVAGLVWRALADNSPLSTSKLVEEVGEPRDMVMQAIGWLAREGKISIQDHGRAKKVALLQP